MNASFDNSSGSVTPNTSHLEAPEEGSTGLRGAGGECTGGGGWGQQPFPPQIFPHTPTLGGTPRSPGMRKLLLLPLHGRLEALNPPTRTSLPWDRLTPEHPGAVRGGPSLGGGAKVPQAFLRPSSRGSPFAPAGRGHSGHSPFGGRAWRCSRPPAGRSAPGSPAAPPPRDARPDRGAGGGRG